MPIWDSQLRSVLLVLLTTLFIAGCSIPAALKGRPGADTSVVAKGSMRDDIEEAIGTPEREWQSIEGVTYCFYEFDGGIKPFSGRAIGWSLYDIATFGGLELAAAIDGNDTFTDPDSLLGADRASLIISYDAEGAVLGVFNEGDQLPPDGIALPEDSTLK